MYACMHVCMHACMSAALISCNSRADEAGPAVRLLTSSAVSVYARARTHALARTCVRARALARSLTHSLSLSLSLTHTQQIRSPAAGWQEGAPWCLGALVPDDAQHTQLLAPDRRSFFQPCVCACMHAWVDKCMYTLHTHVRHACMHTYIHPFINRYIHPPLHTHA